MQISLQSNISFLHHLSMNGKVYSYTLSWDNQNVTEDSAITFSWDIPLKDIFYRWYPGIEDSRGIIADWDEDALTESSIATNAPMICFYNQKGENKCTVAISEFKKLTYMNFGINEKKATLHCYISLPLLQFANAGTFETTFQIRIDDAQMPLETAIGEVSQWWESFLTVAKAPEYVTDTVYSFWYSYHQDITPEVVENECKYIKELGIKSIIVDDGWQTNDNNGGYSFCGDWKPLKFPNMKEHVARVHAMGLKYILWYSVPFLGLKAESYPIFKDKTLFETRGAAVLDPRYKEVREYLIGTYETALREWDLDGFKLDFIDEFVNENNIPANDSMDIKDLSDAVFTLMTDIRTRLKQIKESVVVEFRQTYIGPAMRSYGDFFRVGDCPNDLMKNRWNSVDLRLLCGNTPIHSDMLMWHKEETVENCALQIINALFSVLQISVKLEELTQEHKKMLHFWLDFVKKNKALLQYSPLKVHDMQSLYTLVEGIGAEEKISIVFVPDKCVTVDNSKTIIVNGTQNSTILAEFDGQYDCEVLNCVGENVGNFKTKSAGIFRISVPSAGVIIIKKENKGE